MSKVDDDNMFLLRSYYTDSETDDGKQYGILS